MKNQKYIKIKDNFKQKGSLRADATENRGTIEYIKIMTEEDTGFVYKIDYDGHVHYVAFKLKMYMNDNYIAELFPNDEDFEKGDAVNFMNETDAIQQLEIWKKELQENF